MLFDGLDTLFPGHREHSPEERQAYSDFIESFFEEIVIEEPQPKEPKKE